MLILLLLLLILLFLLVLVLLLLLILILLLLLLVLLLLVLLLLLLILLIVLVLILILLQEFLCKHEVISSLMVRRIILERLLEIVYSLVILLCSHHHVARIVECLGCKRLVARLCRILSCGVVVVERLLDLLFILLAEKRVAKVECGNTVRRIGLQRLSVAYLAIEEGFLVVQRVSLADSRTHFLLRKQSYACRA